MHWVVLNAGRIPWTKSTSYSLQKKCSLFILEHKVSESGSAYVEVAPLQVKMARAVVTIQAAWRMHLQKKVYRVHRQTRAALVIQSLRAHGSPAQQIQVKLLLNLTWFADSI